MDKSQASDKESAAKACSILSAVSRSGFLVAIAVLQQVLKVTYPLSQTLQTACHGLVSATSDRKAILGVVQIMR